MSGKMKNQNLSSTYMKRLKSYVKTEIAAVYITTDSKKFLSQRKALIHESKLDDKRNKDRRWEQMKTNIAELVCEIIKRKQWGIFFKHEPIQALPVQDNTVLYKVNQVKEEELVQAIEEAMEARIRERKEEWQDNQIDQNQTSQKLSNGTKTTSDDTRE